MKVWLNSVYNKIHPTQLTGAPVNSKSNIELTPIIFERANNPVMEMALQVFLTQKASSRTTGIVPYSGYGALRMLLNLEENAFMDAYIYNKIDFIYNIYSIYLFFQEYY